MPNFSFLVAAEQIICRTLLLAASNLLEIAFILYLTTTSSFLFQYEFVVFALSNFEGAFIGIGYSVTSTVLFIIVWTDFFAFSIS